MAALHGECWRREQESLRSGSGIEQLLRPRTCRSSNDLRYEISETFPTLTHWLWQARDNGAKLIVVDPRLTPIARTADLHLPIRPGRDSALYGAILHQLDQARLA